MIDDDVASELRGALLEAAFTPQAVGELLGPPAHRALLRNETTPALRATDDGSPLATLTRLFSLQRPVDAGLADQALPGLVDRLCLAGMLERTVSEVRARVDVRPYGDNANTPVRIAIAVVSFAVIVAAVYISKRRPVSISEAQGDTLPAA